ncbi:MAG: hypothetical protein VX640_11025 [Pseudomonadota bacterium]|nr:hypothetical protein [Pseudomonadota bacterium]
MTEDDWKQFDKLYKVYEEARGAYQTMQTHLHGAFSELARHYDKDSLDNDLYEEELAHKRFNTAREALLAFLREKLKKD